MNTQLNSAQPTPEVTLYNLNAGIMQIVSDFVMEKVETDEDHVQWLVEFNEAIKAVAGQMNREQLRTLENAPWFLAMPYGYDMFLMGLAIGRDPLSVLTLPEGKNRR